MASVAPIVSIIIPTRSRAHYLKHTIQTCLDIRRNDIEIVVLDNASADNTQEILGNISDKRFRYFRSNELLSMRNNFERGFELSRGSILCFIGDDDGVFPDAIERVLLIFEKYEVDAVMSNHARYYWPDTPSNRKNHCMVSRRSGLGIRNSKDLLGTLPIDGQYMKLPCMYYGFVRRNIFERIIARQGRFFLTNMPDVYSSVALSMEGVNYAYTEQPLCVAGVSAKSNGGRMNSIVTGQRDQFLAEWKKEDDVGFLPGFDNWKTINCVIVEQGLSYVKGNVGTKLTDIFNLTSVQRALAIENIARLKASASSKSIILMYESAGISYEKPFLLTATILRSIHLALYHFNSFLNNMPLQFRTEEVDNVHSATIEMFRLINQKRTGYFKNVFAQIRATINFMTN